MLFQGSGSISVQLRQLQRSGERKLQLVSGLHRRGGPSVGAKNSHQRQTGKCSLRATSTALISAAADACLLCHMCSPVIFRSTWVCRPAASKCVWGTEPRRKLWWRESSRTRSTLKTHCGAWSLENVWLWVNRHTHTYTDKHWSLLCEYLNTDPWIYLSASSCLSVRLQKSGGTLCWKERRRLI